MLNRTPPELPLVVVGCDFRRAPVRLREALVTTPEQRATLLAGITSVEPGAGLVVLETCNRVEWIVSCETPAWFAELLTAQMLRRWRVAVPEAADGVAPYVHLGREAARHVLRVVAGLESLAAGEAQIAGQFQAAHSRALEEHAASAVINGLAKHAGRLAKTALRSGYRSDHRRGIHRLAADYLKLHLPGTIADCTIVVAGMGAIGRKTAQIIEQELGAKVVRVNRTVAEQHRASWQSFEDLPQLLTDTQALVVATGALCPVIHSTHFGNIDTQHPLLVLDIGIPRQLSADAQQLHCVSYRNLDDLMEVHDGNGNGNLQLAQQLEQEIDKELDLFKRFCIERNIVSVLEDTQRRREEFFLEQIPALVSSNFAHLDQDTRRAIESAMKQLVSDYSYYSFNSIHSALEKYWGEE